TFVLVLGAWGGGWEWRWVRAGLRSAGHEVFTPTLTGLGERAHLISPGVGLSTHIEDVTAVIESEELTDVVLCGQSSGGMVVTGVADRDPERIAHVAYLDALVPSDGQSMVDLIPSTSGAGRESMLWLHPPSWLAGGDGATWRSMGLTMSRS